MRVSARGLNIAFSQETPSGTVDGVNDEFTLSSVPYSEESIIVFLDGIALELGFEWALAGQVVVISPAPELGQKLYVWYLKK